MFYINRSSRPTRPIETTLHGLIFTIWLSWAARNTFFAEKREIIQEAEDDLYPKAYPLVFSIAIKFITRYIFFVPLLGRWYKANTSPVCFGTRNSQFGKFFLPSSGKLVAIRLDHLYGFVSCNTGSNSNWSFWGCGNSRDQVNVVVTNAANQIILPPNQFFKLASKWSRVTVPYYNAAFAPEIVFSVFSHPRQVNKGQEFRVWYGEDLTDLTENDNGGRVCCDVYALYV